MALRSGIRQGTVLVCEFRFEGVNPVIRLRALPPANGKRGNKPACCIRAGQGSDKKFANCKWQ